MGKRWKNDKRYSEFIASYIPHVIRLLPILFGSDNESIDSSDSEGLIETGEERYNRIAGRRNTPSTCKKNASYEQLDKCAHELSIYAEKEEEKGNFGKASLFMQQAIEYQMEILKNIPILSTESDIEIRKVSRLISLLDRIRKKDGIEDSYVTSSIKVIDELFSINDTIAIHTAVQIAAEWDCSYKEGDVFVKYLERIAKAKVFSQETRIYERACLLRAEAFILSTSRNGLVDACKKLQLASQIVYHAEGFSIHYFDIKASEVLFYIYNGQSIGIRYLDIVKYTEKYLDELKHLANYKEFYEYIEVKSTLIRKQSMENKDWERIISYAEELINYHEDGISMVGVNTKYKTCTDRHFYSIGYCMSFFMPTCHWNQQYIVARLCLMAYRNTNGCCINKNIAKICLLRGYENRVQLIQRGLFDNETIEEELSSASFIAANTDSKECADLSLNYVLLCKGLQLYSYHILNNINQIGVNKEMASLMGRYKTLQKEVAISSFNGSSDLKKKKAELRDVTYDLFKKASEIDYFTNYFSSITEDINRCLKSGELAIEFSTYQTLPDSTTYITAHILDGSTHNIKTMKVCKLNVLQVLSGNINCTSMYDIIWKNIIAQYNGIKKIFFSPIDILHRLPIENGLNGICPSYRLSSIRQLLTNNTPNKEKAKSAVLYGGLLYEYDSDSLKTNTERGAYNPLYLPSTLLEIEKIREIIQSNGWSSIVFKGDNGTEKSISNIDFKSISILHFATHGYFVHSDIKGELSLKNSGLLLANCRYNIDNIPIGPKEDGVLTALEVSDMDLRFLDLVTLSACETGLGEVSGEGVFGLQRGFKKAGVNSILMSLWKVDDEATCKLMTEFYNNWIAKKMTKHDALEAAKKVVRATKGWEDPKYWAAFILLDALD